jgi:hypothetical protein
VSKAPKASKIPWVTSGADIGRINRNFWILKPALEAAGLHESKMQRVLDTLLLEIEFGSRSVKAYRSGKRRAQLNHPKWHSPTAARADELRREWPRYRPNRIANMIRKEGKIAGLPGHRQVADFIMEIFSCEVSLGSQRCYLGNPP